MQIDRLSLAAWTSALLIASALFSNTVALRLLLLVMCFGLALVVAVREHGTVRTLPPLWAAFLLWAAWAWLSLAWSVEPERSLKELRNETVYVAIAFWMCYVAAQARESARVVLPIVGAAVVMLCAVALYNFPVGLLRNGERWHGGPGNLSTIVLILMPCALMVGWYAHRVNHARLRNWALALMVLLLAAAYTTLNRTVWFGIAFEFVLIAGIVALRDGSASSLRAKAVGAAAVVAAVAAATLMSELSEAERYVGPIVVAGDARLKLWPEVLEHIKERPLTGYGFGRGLLREPLRAELKHPHLWHAHNLFLEAVLQVGIPGLVFLLILLAATLREGWRLARAPDALAAACGIALLGVVGGMLIRNMTDTLWVRHNALAYWAVLGVLLAWGYRAQANQR
jgi:O-antigen ligase